MTTPIEMPHDDAPISVWHAWLCHGALPDGTGGEECPDGCDGDFVDAERLAAMRQTQTQSTTT